MILLDGVSKRFGARPTLDGLDLTVPEGTAFGLAGNLGAGKTTVLRILATLVRPDDGTATVGGVRVDRDPERVRRLIGYLPDTAGVYLRQTVREDLEFYGAIHGVAVDRRRPLAGQLLEVLGLADHADDDVSSLTKGERRRLGLARTLVHDPKVLLLDEPAAGLDIESREEVEAVIRDLAGMGRTMLISGRVIADLERMCPTVGLLESGRMAAVGTPAEMCERVDATRPGERLRPTGAAAEP